MTLQTFLADNIRYLRMQKTRLSQEKIADAVGITRDRYSKYENGKVALPLEVLVALSRFYHVSTDLLLTVDLRKYKLEELLKLSDNRILLPIKTDSRGENQIEIIPYKASMGYLAGYSDPEYIENLKTMSLPFLQNGKYRAFPVEGDSMPPYKDGSYIIGRYIEALNDLKIGKTYIFITREGITYKRLEDQSETKVRVAADNKFYTSYEIPKENLLEIWEYRCSVATEEFDVIDTESKRENILRLFADLKNEILNLKM
ncbi:XRE family transcriptional regulator [Chryseobacterium sp. DT-3]|uniref:XRE family transcriptional regulator n=1 Tax=Chryseobacterium sp. DT-3 TaxID=3396164 RepID=UPI003F19B0BB